MGAGWSSSMGYCGNAAHARRMRERRLRSDKIKELPSDDARLCVSCAPHYGWKILRQNGLAGMRFWAS